MLTALLLAASAAAPEPPGCAVVLAVLRQQRTPFRLGANPEPVGSLGGGDLPWLSQVGASGPPAPPAGLVDRLKREDGRSPLALCPSVKRWAARNRVTIVGRVTPTDRYPQPIVSVSMPAISADGRSAVIATGDVCGILCGSGSLYHLRRGPKGWQVARVTSTWIS
jgi:hypothetical protein